MQEINDTFIEAQVNRLYYNAYTQVIGLIALYGQVKKIHPHILKKNGKRKIWSDNSKEEFSYSDELICTITKKVDLKDLEIILEVVSGEWHDEFSPKTNPTNS
jgi:hypothetical protein